MTNQTTTRPNHYYQTVVNPYVGMIRRGIAYWIDQAVIGALVTLVANLLRLDSWADYVWADWGLTLILAVGYFVLVTYLTQGQTLGKMALRIRVVNAEGGPLTWREVLMREAVGFVIQREFPLLVLYLWMNPYKQTVADWLSDTYVIHDNYYSELEAVEL